MSFVYIAKMNGMLDMYCCILMGLDDFAGEMLSREQIRCVDKYGVLKITVDNEEQRVDNGGRWAFP